MIQNISIDIDIDKSIVMINSMTIFQAKKNYQKQKTIEIGSFLSITPSVTYDIKFEK